MYYDNLSDQSILQFIGANICIQADSVNAVTNNSAYFQPSSALSIV